MNCSLHCTVIQSNLVFIRHVMTTTPLGAHKILKKFKRHRCGHENAALDAASCLASMVGEGNAEHYIIATQDTELRKQLRSTAGLFICLCVYVCLHVCLYACLYVCLCV